MCATRSSSGTARRKMEACFSFLNGMTVAIHKPSSTDLGPGVVHFAVKDEHGNALCCFSLEVGRKEAVLHAVETSPLVFEGVPVGKDPCFVPENISQVIIGSFPPSHLGDIFVVTRGNLDQVKLVYKKK